MTAPLLQIDGVTIDYNTKKGNLRALRDISFDVNKGEIVGIVGESGCGKSTLISTILQLLPQNAEWKKGAINFKGKNLIACSEKEMRDMRGKDISVIFQDPMQSLNPVITIGRQMVDIQHRSTSPYAEKWQKSIDMLSMVGIADAETRLKQHPFEFSGGMLQRIAIAMALMSRPDLLIADEPTTALDATLEVEIIKRLKDLHKEMGCSILFISHHLGVIAELCQRVVVMYAGSAVEFGSVDEIFFNPKHPYTRRLIECDPGHIKERAKRLPTIPGEIPDLTEALEGCIFQERCSETIAKCKTAIPPLVSVGQNHQAACWLNHNQEPE